MTTFDASNGLITCRSQQSVDQTVASLRELLDAKGVKLFALIDHSGEAAKVGMTMPATKLLIFGDPKAGTPLMLASESSAIDLPLKVLIWEDKEGGVQLTYNSPEYLRARHGLKEDMLKNIAGIEALVNKAADEGKKSPYPEVG
ncbi:MAG: DUF302 domain-containing protein [Acidobacteriota bacterium]|nr:DUF302 domain-containing protein [Acidobacteriota bacterium]